MTVLSGCVQDQAAQKKVEGSGDHDEFRLSQSNSTKSPSNNTTDPDAPDPRLEADKTNGSAPLKVNFTMSDASNASTAWTLDFGDGNSTNGTELPAEAAHAYGAGNFTAVLEVVDEAGESYTDSVNITAGKNAKPAKTEFTTGPRVGCYTEAGPGACPAVVRGTSDTVFGFWIKLEPGHVGMNFTTKSLSGDSDGWFFDDPTKAPLKDVHNGGDEASGIVPANAKWLLIVPWAVPSDKLAVTFKAA